MASVEATNDPVATRERLKADWLDRLNSLVESIEGWSAELGWSTRRIEKSLDDAEVGAYRAPALLLQDQATRALLDPIGRSTPTSEGVVDLYLMPAFDDVARLYLRDGRWWLLHVPPEDGDDDAARGVEPTPLTPGSLRGVLENLKTHAG